VVAGARSVGAAPANGGGYHGARGEIRVSHGRDEDDDVAPFGSLNFECLDAATCHSRIG